MCEYVCVYVSLMLLNFLKGTAEMLFLYLSIIICVKKIQLTLQSLSLKKVLLNTISLMNDVLLTS